MSALSQMTPQERGRYALELAERVRRRLVDSGMTIEHEHLGAGDLRCGGDGLSLLAECLRAATAWPVSQLGSEFMPELDEGSLLYMPITNPGLSITKVGEMRQTEDRIIKSFPEVASVFGKAGRAGTATDPAPTEMFETVISLKPQEERRPGLTIEGLVAEMDQALKFPGVITIWTKPIKARIDMLSTGIRTPVGVKVFGPDLGGIERLATEIEAVVRTVPGATSAYAERLGGGRYLEIEPDRDAIARYGLSLGDVQEVIATALGGEIVTTAVEGRERYGVIVRYPRDLRSDPRAIASDVLVGTGMPWCRSANSQRSA